MDSNQTFEQILTFIRSKGLPQYVEPIEPSMDVDSITHILPPPAEDLDDLSYYLLQNPAAAPIYRDEIINYFDQFTLEDLTRLFDSWGWPTQNQNTHLDFATKYNEYTASFTSGGFMPRILNPQLPSPYEI